MKAINIMIKTAGWIAGAIIIVVVGFQYRYESLDPCEWMTQEMAGIAGVSGITGLGNTAGVVLNKGECLQNWMDLRVKGAENK